MNDELKKAAAKSLAASQGAYPRERAQYKALLLSNPNYFGNLDTSPYKPVLPLASNTYYEELGCVGYQPQQEMLEGVVYVYQPSGYGGDLCSAGSTEYVRFYLSFDNGLTWQDQGLTSFQVWNVPQGTDGSKRLEYAVQLKVDPSRLLCLFGTRLIRMRGILSRNAPPPPNQPTWNPPWGNRRDATIEVEPARLIILNDLFKALKVKVPAPLGQVVDLQQALPSKQPMLSVAELGQLYADTPVPAHRFAYKELHALVQGKAAATPDTLSQLLPGVTLDPKLPDILIPPDTAGDGNTSYEELRCIGLDPNSPDTLVGVLHIKRAQGYNGGPCTAGSTEYVSWWADVDHNGSFETFLGTASVKVHDIANLPAEGIQMAVRLPIDANAWRKRCHDGAVVIPIRAILSWNVPVPGNAPNTVPAWGNREQTLIHLAPLGAVHGPAGEIAILGGIPVSMIHDTTGLTTSDAVFALNNVPVGGDAPFGGIVTVQGAPLPAGYSYKVEVRPEAGGVPQPLLETLTLTRADGTTHTHAPNAATQRYDYVPFADNVIGLLARWHSVGDERWIVTLSTYDPGGTLVGQQSHRLQLDNTLPTADIDITSGTGNCGKFPAGSTISGTFTATDLHLASWSIGIKPPGINDPGEAITSPSSGTVNVAGGAWSLDTTGMIGCGYIAEIHVVDRTIVHSQSQGWHRLASVGFCLEEAGGGEEPVLTGAEADAPTGVATRTRPADDD